METTAATLTLNETSQEDQLDRIEAKLDAVLAGIGRVDALVEQAGPALAELGTMAEKMATGGIMSLLKPGKK